MKGGISGCKSHNYKPQRGTQAFKIKPATHQDFHFNKYTHAALGWAGMSRSMVAALQTADQVK